MGRTESPRAFAFVASAIGAWQLFMPSAAEARTDFTLDTSAEAEIATNPYLLRGPELEAASAIISLSPAIVVSDAKGTFSVSGRVQHREFSRRYSSTQDFTGGASLNRRLDARFGVSANARFVSSIEGDNAILFSGANGVGGTPAGPPVLVPLPPIIDDITLIGNRIRRNAFSGGVGLSFAASVRDQVTLSYSGIMARYPSAAATAQEYNSFGQTFTYNRVIDNRTSVGASVSVSRADYLRTELGDGTTISPQLTGSITLNPQWSLSASIGASFTEIRDLTGKDRRTSLAGTANLCRTDVRSTLCINAQRSSGPTSFGALSTQSTVGASYRYQLSPRDDASFTASYSRSARNDLSTVSPTELVETTFDYTRRFKGRLRGVVSLTTTQVFDGSPTKNRNASASIGLRYLLAGGR